MLELKHLITVEKHDVTISTQIRFAKPKSTVAPDFDSTLKYQLGGCPILGESIS